MVWVGVSIVNGVVPPLQAASGMLAAAEAAIASATGVRAAPALWLQLGVGSAGKLP